MPAIPTGVPNSASFHRQRVSTCVDLWLSLSAHPPAGGCLVGMNAGWSLSFPHPALRVKRSFLRARFPPLVASLALLSWSLVSRCLNSLGLSPPNIDTGAPLFPD